MLRVSLHTGTLAERSLHNQLLSMDIAYREVAPLATYMVALSARQSGEQVAILENYPRWSASLWDLIARCLARVLYTDQAIPPSIKPDRRCAYATRICAVIEGVGLTFRGKDLGTAEIVQKHGCRGIYQVVFTEDILGERTAEFAYGSKRMDYADFLMRAICWALFQQDTLGPRPKLILPQTAVIDREERFDVEGLTEPARTGFSRFLARKYPTSAALGLARAEDYVAFLCNKD